MITTTRTITTVTTDYTPIEPVTTITTNVKTVRLVPLGELGWSVSGHDGNDEFDFKFSNYDGAWDFAQGYLGKAKLSQEVHP